MIAVPLLVGIAFLVACGGDGDEGAPAATAVPDATPAAVQPAPANVRVVEVQLAFPPPRFRPDPVVLKVGEPIQFKLISIDTKHTFTVEALGIDEEIPQKNQNQIILAPIITPQEVGEFLLFCRIHVRLPMEGKVMVTE